MSFKPLPPVERVRELLDYEPSTGLFTWKVRRSSNALAGQPAGTIHSRGYWRITIDDCQYLAHRLAWLHHHGVDPLENLIDHKDTDCLNNSIGNLRLADHSQNLSNSNRRRDSKSPYKGVHYYKRVGKWMAGIRVKGKKIHLGYFSNPEDARDAYNRKALELKGSFARFD